MKTFMIVKGVCHVLSVYPNDEVFFLTNIKKKKKEEGLISLEFFI